MPKVLNDTGRFDVRLEEEPNGINAETLAPFDVLVGDYCGPRWPEVTEKAVEEFVRSGKGLVVVHAAGLPLRRPSSLGRQPDPDKADRARLA